MISSSQDDGKYPFRYDGAAVCSCRGAAVCCLAFFFTVVILFLLCSEPALAAVHSLPAEKKISVYAKSVYTLPENTLSARSDGSGNYIAESSDGTRIRLTPKSSLFSLRLVIHPITIEDPLAYAWLSGCVMDLGTHFLFYDIYFVDEYGNRVDAEVPLAVSVTLSNPYSTIQVAQILTDESVSHLASSGDSDQITFSIEKGGYYAIATAGTGTTAPAKTGDDSRTEIWMVLFVASGMFFIAILRKMHYAHDRTHS